MPATIDELCAFVRALIAGEVAPDTVPRWDDGTTATEAEQREIQGLLFYEVMHRIRIARIAATTRARRKALRLLRTFLTAEQRAELARRRCFIATAPSGRIFCFYPGIGRVEEVERHGSRFFVRRSFCLHPEAGQSLPSADVTLAQLLLLAADEEAFLQKANVTERGDQLWNGEWLRRVAANRREGRAAG